MFCDLALTLQKNSTTAQHVQLLSTAYELGYRVVACHQEISSKEITKKTLRPVTIPQEITRPRALSRLTVVLEAADNNYSMGSGNALLAPFDIIAVRPTTEKALQIACSTLDVDIISLNLSSRLPFYLKHTLINQAISRGICFEITYAPAIRNAASRRQLISNATSLVRVTRGRHIIVASDAATALELRGPYDIINFCSLFGMNQSAARDCLTHNARQVLYHAATRRAVHKGTVALADDIASALDEKPSISIDTDAIMNDNDDDDDDTMDVKE